MARELGELINTEFDCPIEYIDERFSTQQMEHARQKASSKKRRIREKMDDWAAVEILQGWLDYRQNRP